MMRHLRRTRFVRELHAGPIVEFAVVVPVLLLILFGLLDFAIAFIERNNLVTAVREGGRYAAAFPRPCDAGFVDSVRNVVDRRFSMVNSTRPAAAAIIVTRVPEVCNTTPNGIQEIQVRITNHPFRPINPAYRLLAGGNITMSASSVFRWERSQ